MDPRVMSSESAGRPGRWSPVVVDRPVVAFAARPPEPGGQYRPDTVCDGWATGHFTVRMASVRGYAHRYHRTPRQDEAAVSEHPGTGAVVFAVADGVSAARWSHLGAANACSTAIEAMHAALDAGPDPVDWTGVFAAAADGLAEPAGMYACTLVAGLVRPAAGQALATIARVGDSTAWLLRDGVFREVFGADDTYLLSSAVQALPSVPELVHTEQVALPHDGVLLIGTDGFGGPLGAGSGPVGRMFAGALAEPPPPLELAHTLDFSRETFDDDRTVVAIWPIAVPANARAEPS